MNPDVSRLEAEASLATVERSRLQVVDEIDLPRWYVWGLAACWVGLGVTADLNQPWLTVAATFAFGTAHAAIAPRFMTGRHRTGQLSVSARVAGRRIRTVVIVSLLALVALTVVVALVLNADGAGHPTTLASVYVATVILLGEPALLAAIRRRVAGTNSPS